MTGFKSRKQQAAVMASLRARGKLKNMSFSQLNTKGIKLPPKGDADRDGVININDCKPLNKNEQGIIKELIKAKEGFAKRRAIKLEKKQDKLLVKIDSEKTSLKKHLKVQKAINENKKLKGVLKDLRKANFKLSTTGKILAVTGKGAQIIGQGVSKAARNKAVKRFFKQGLS